MLRSGNVSLKTTVPVFHLQVFVYRSLWIPVEEYSFNLCYNGPRAIFSTTFQTYLHLQLVAITSLLMAFSVPSNTIWLTATLWICYYHYPHFDAVSGCLGIRNVIKVAQLVSDLTQMVSLNPCVPGLFFLSRSFLE
jgi:hypothetical protein